MAAVRAARAGSLAKLREAYAAPVGQSTASSRLIDAEDDWPVVTAQQFSSAPDADMEESLESEWDAVAARTDILRLEQKANFGKIQPKDEGATAMINYKEVQVWVRQLCADTQVLKPLENRSSQDCRSRSLGSSLRRRSHSPAGLDRQKSGGKDIVFHLRQTPFDFNTVTHFRMLRTLYTKLTNNKWCPSIGSHWEVLGFQGGDPRTHLNRSGGTLNILHLFFFVAHHPELATACFQLSLDDHQNFPLACISINITSLVLESLSAGRLSALCSKESSDLGVLELTCRLHSAGLAYFCSRWRSQKRTIEHTEQTRNEVKALLERKPAKLLEELSLATQGARLKKTAASVPEFADLEVLGGAVEAPPRAQRRGLWARSKAALPKRLRPYQDENAQA